MIFGIIFSFTLFGFLRLCTGGPVRWTIGSGVGNIYCPPGEVLVAAPTELAETLERHPSLYKYIGRNSIHIDTTDRMIPHKPVDGYLDFYIDRFQCAEEKSVINISPAQVPDSVINIGDHKCGYVISSYPESLPYATCERYMGHSMSIFACYMYLRQNGRQDGRPDDVIYTHVYYTNATKVEELDKDGVFKVLNRYAVQCDSCLKMGQKGYHGDQGEVTLAVGPYDINYVIIGFEVFSRVEHRPGIERWDPGECWRRKQMQTTREESIKGFIQDYPYLSFSSQSSAVNTAVLGSCSILLLALCILTFMQGFKIRRRCIQLFHSPRHFLHIGRNGVSPQWQ